MPIIAVNLPPKVYAQIKELVDREVYTDPEQFIEIATFNQLALERGRSRNRTGTNSRVQIHKTDGGPARVATDAVAPSGQSHGTRVARTGRSRPVGKKRQSANDLPSDEVQKTLSRLGFAMAREMGPTPAIASAGPDNEHIWGQVNRVFPLKIACRCLACNTAGKEEWPTLDAIIDLLAGDAAVVGSVLAQADAAAGRKRDQQLGTGLPRRGNSASRDRFAAQYIARTTRGRDIFPGAICQYALATFEGDRLALTACGLEFAQLTNPVLDESAKSSVACFCQEERLFLHQHISDSVPGELKDYALIYSAVRAGTRTPEELAAAVRGDFPRSWTSSAFRTHISGLVSRMVELGILTRKWSGRRVTYEAVDLKTTALATERFAGLSNKAMELFR